MKFDDVIGSAAVSREEFRDAEPQLRIDLLNAQFSLRQADFPVIVLIEGDDSRSANQMVDLLNEWLDARHMDTHVFVKQTEEERLHPRFWRYWRALPGNGRIGLLLGGWHLRAIGDRLRGKLDDDGLRRRLQTIRGFEQTLVADGALLLKFWFHVPKKELKKRLKRSRKDTKHDLYIGEKDWELYENYDEAIPVAEETTQATDAPGARWLVVNGSDRRSRELTVTRTLLTALLERQASGPTAPVVSAVPPPPAAALASVDLSARLTEDEYEERLERGQARLGRLTLKARRKKLSSVLVFEGWDAAGKGGCIRRLTRAMYARDYRVVPIAAPSDEERAQHYLWRFWRRLPRSGSTVIFDRSWYGRVLVERVEGFARQDEWRRAYAEINGFEEQLAERGIVQKFWLHLDADEQLRRFKSREQTPYKKYKITDEDYRNRERWDDYARAVDEMIARTDNDQAPWHLVPANDKRFARVMVLEAVVQALEREL